MHLEKLLPTIGLLALVLTAAPEPARAQDDQPTVLAKPSPEQAAWQDCEIGMFIHFSMNTWLDKEYDDLSWPLAKFNPEKLDTDQWAAAAEAMGAKYIVFVAKHVGGFCMWQTETTDYGVKDTPWRDGKGDVMADLAESCRKRKIKLGVYLSPADRKQGAGVGGRCANEEAQRRYDKIYRQQLTELLSRYGEMYEVWFDGSNVVDVGDILKKHAPHAMVFQGPHATIRWVGNEGGVAPYPAWNAVSQENARSGVATARHGDADGTDWIPNECDARIRANWFWNTRNAPTLKSVDQLMAMYYRSVGHGAVLLLNHTPDTTGLIPAADFKRGAEFGAEIRRRFGKSLGETAGEGNVVELDLDKPTWIDHVIAMEEIRQGERVREYVVEGLVDGSWQTLCEGTAVGYKKIDRLQPVQVSKIRFRVTKAAASPRIRRLAVYSVGGQPAPLEPPSQTPVSHFACDDISDGKLLDSSGRKRHGTVHAATIAAGRTGKALKFDGRRSYVDLGNLPLFVGDFTIAARINPRGAGAGMRTILSKETTGTGSNQCRFYLTEGNRLGFMFCGAIGGGLWPFESSAEVPNDTFSHVAVTRRGAQFTLHLNGKPIGRKTAPEPINHRNADRVLIGAIRDTAGDLGSLFDGAIDDLRVYNRSLDEKEIGLLPTAGPSAPAWRWSSKNVTTDWTTVEIDIAPFCDAATQYLVEFKPTGGRDALQIKSIVPLFDGREAPEFIERIGQSNKFYVTIPGLGIPLTLRTVLRGQGGTDTAGAVLVEKKP